MSAYLSKIAASWGARAALAILVIAGVAWFASSWLSGFSAKTEARLKTNQVEAAIASGQDAVNTIGTHGAIAEEIDTITKENEDEIQNAEGADTAVPDPVRNAGLRSLCRRAAYRKRAECLQFTDPE